MRTRGMLLWLGATVVLTVARQADAEDRVFVALEYEVSPPAHGCPEEAGLRSMVAARLAYDPFRADARRRVVVRINPSGDGLEGRIEWWEADGRSPGDRRFAQSRRDCGGLARTIAFALAVHLQLLGGAEPARDDAGEALDDAPAAGAAPRAGPPAPPAPNPTTPSSATAATAAPPATLPPRGAASGPDTAVRTAASRAGALTLAIGGGPSLAYGVAPEAAVGARLFASGRRGWAAVELDVEGTLPSTAPAPDQAGIRHHRLAAMIAGCYAPARFAGCIVADAARLTVRGVGVDTPAGGSGLAFDVGARAAVTGGLGARLFVRARAEALFALTSFTVTLNGAPVWTRPRLAATLGVDFGLRFE